MISYCYICSYTLERCYFKWFIWFFWYVQKWHMTEYVLPHWYCRKQHFLFLLIDKHVYNANIAKNISNIWYRSITRFMSIEKSICADLHKKFVYSVHFILNLWWISLFLFLKIKSLFISALNQFWCMYTKCGFKGTKAQKVFAKK